MPRYRLMLEYDGAGFVGWQRQTNGLAVQQVIEEGIHAFTGETVTAIAAGRTDSGVHALAMTVHADIAREMPASKIRDALAHHVRPHPVTVLSVEAVHEGFSARFDCVKRQYLYRILNRAAVPALNRGRVWHVAQPLDVDAMNRAAAHLHGHHDFESFRSAHCQADTAVKTLDTLEVTREGEEVRIVCSARSFLHNQVRIMAGTLVDVGKGRWTPAEVRAALKARDRTAAGPTAPAHGLYFVKAEYPPR
ncbi:MAG: tRNA pseudouridine(38,39,40) synthase TruA [Rhizobiales bacterium NRL2]|jgi:tRNA pseudouridine38-40 synthase|nr:MAG: tRNA pseudouridine(38,39,40) synthase TruA [Rhizobiales bacterium NRL2]